MTIDVRGNKLFLVCTVCGPDIQHSLELARRKNAGFDRVTDRRPIEAWFDQHAACGGGKDHFKLGMLRNPDWDRAIPAEPDSNVKAAVRLALVSSDQVKI